MGTIQNTVDGNEYLRLLRDQRTTKIPILKGCPNSQCFCTGKCKEVIGYRDRLPEEMYPNLLTNGQ